VTAWQTAGTSAFLKLVNGFDGAEDHLQHVSTDGLSKIAESARALAAMVEDLASRKAREEGEVTAAVVYDPLPRRTREPYGGYEPPYGSGARIRS
jgi:hypothetical protein